MTFRFATSLVILLFFLYLLDFLCSGGSSLVKDEVGHIVKYPRTDFVKIVHNKTIDMIETTDVTVDNLDVDPKTFGLHIGEYPIKHSYGARMFYYLFESRRSKSDPVILWLNGGPGSSCLIEVFEGNGPFRINDDLSLKRNTFGWDNVAHMLYVDQPIGTGYSFSLDHRDTRHRTNETASDLYDFLQEFFQDHPEFTNNDFYITGSSYSGKTIPVLASQIHKRIKEDIHINLKGIAIANGMTNPIYHYSNHLYFAYLNKLISKREWWYWKRPYAKCLKSIKHCYNDDGACDDAHNMCVGPFNSLFLLKKKINYQDFREKISLSMNWTFINKLFAFLDSDSVSTDVPNRAFVLQNPGVYKAMLGDFFKNYEADIPTLLNDGIKILIFDGEYALLYSWLGNLKWLESLKWSGQSQFSTQKLTPYNIDDEKIGEVKRAGPLTFIKVHNAGHGVTLDQPKVSLNIIKEWMRE